MPDATRRFSGRVHDYLRYRPGYPPALLDALLAHSNLEAGAVAADVGSGTGIFTRLLLAAGLRVYAVEPNPEMRDAAEQLFADEKTFTSVAAPAEDTGLGDGSLDLITAAQAFHWFNNEAARAEFERILKADGFLALIWNKRRTEQAFQRDYDGLLRKWAPEYIEVNHMKLDDGELAGYFAAGGMQVMRFDNSQNFDFDGLLGRVKSSSYCPAEDSAAFESLQAELRVLFDRHANSGGIDFDYDTRLYIGRLRR